MKATIYPNKLPNKTKSIMILGSFNSFHNGHNKILLEAKKYNKKIIILIIENPQIIPSKKNKIYESLEVRMQQISNLGVYGAVLLKLSKELLNMQGKDFAKKIKEIYKVDKFFVGKDFAMGKNASYKAIDLKKDFPTEIINTKKINNIKISSSLLIEMVNLGDVDIIKQLSPFAFTIKTQVDENNNFQITKSANLHNGIYASWAVVNDIKYWSIVRISSFSKNEIIIPDLLVKNVKYNVWIEFRKKTRTIIKKELDKIEEEDKNKVINFLKNNL